MKEQSLLEIPTMQEIEHQSRGRSSVQEVKQRSSMPQTWRPVKVSNGCMWNQKARHGTAEGGRSDSEFSRAHLTMSPIIGHASQSLT